MSAGRESPAVRALADVAPTTRAASAASAASATGATGATGATAATAATAAAEGRQALRVFAGPGGCLEPPEEGGDHVPLGWAWRVLWLAAFALAVLVGCGDGPPGEAVHDVATAAAPSAGAPADGKVRAEPSESGTASHAAGEPDAADATALAAPRPPHVLLISIDTLRADHLGCYGHTRDTSPWIDSLAARGLRLSQAQAQATMTLSSHASLFTSLYPPQFGLVRNDGVNVDQAATRLRLPDTVTTLAELLAGAGYRTAAFTGGALLDPRYGLAQGFEHFQAATDMASSGLATSVPWLLEWLDAAAAADDDSPLFLFLHSFDVHDPYKAEAPFASRFSDGDAAAFEAAHGLPPSVPALMAGARPAEPALRAQVEALYDNGIRQVDAALAELEQALAARGLWDELLVVLVSDHGEEFAEHGGWGHGPRPFHEVLHVPWILRLPGDARAGTVLDDPVALLDVAPTVADVLGLERPASWRGLSQWPRLTGAAPPPTEPRLLYADNQYATPDVRRAQVGDDVLVLDYTSFGQQLFDRGSDPGEQDNLASAHGARAEALRQRFEAWLGALIQQSRAYVAVPMEPGAMNHQEAQRAMLEALGYTR